MARELDYAGTLEPGDVLVITTDSQIVTLNGANAMKDITGDWILIDDGDNEVDYEDDEVSRTVTVQITWSPKWL